MSLRRFGSGLLVVFVALLALPDTSEARQFYRTEGKQILDPDGNPTVIRGMGLGGWLMPEGYMLKMGGSWSDMQEKVLDVMGEPYATALWEDYRARYVAEKDIAALAEWGFDHIRLPFHYEVFYDIDTRTFREEGFTLLDEFLGWCGTYGLPVILDLHAAPGAQSDGAIADSDGVARLWTEPDPYQDMTVELWEEFARRYKDDTRIMGYDLINEPVTPNSVADGAQALRDLYGRLADAIRAIDTNHILFIEGNYFATTFDKLTPPFDDNMVYAFHKYWNAPSIGTIGYLLAIRDEFNVPLWLGETGENSNPWIYEVTRLAESEGIAWNYWTHKQVGATVTPVSTPLSADYQRVLDYWNGNASKPSTGFARQALRDMVWDLDLDSTDARPDVLAAMFDPDFATARRPYADNRIPGTINSTDYDIGNQGVAYSDQDTWAVSGSPGGGNSGGQLRNDGVDIERSSDPMGHTHNVGWLNPLEWMEYTVTVDQAGVYDIDVRVASLGGGGSMSISMDGARLGTTITIPQTNGWQNWVTETITGVTLEAGQKTMRVAVGRKGDFNLGPITFGPASGVGTASEPELPTALKSVYPMPSSGAANVVVSTARPAETEFAVYDILGRSVLTEIHLLQPGESTVALDLKGLAPGTYVLRLNLTSGSDVTTFTHMMPVFR